MTTLAEALPAEINRVRKIKDQLKQMRGMKGVMVDPTIAIMETSIRTAISAASEGSVIDMMRAYEDLQGYSE